MAIATTASVLAKNGFSRIFRAKVVNINVSDHELNEMSYGLGQMASPRSHVQALLPDTSCLKLKSVKQDDGGPVLILAAASSSVAYCPSFHRASRSLHSEYSRDRAQ